MSYFSVALWAEVLKVRRSKVPWLVALGFSMTPLVGGLFMWILKDPERARSMGIIAAKAQLTAGVADWPAFFGLLLQATAISGALLFAFFTAWIFGREFSDHTAKELLAMPTPRGAVVAAKYAVIVIWVTGLIVLIYWMGLAVGSAVGMPGWSDALARQAAGRLAAIAGMTVALITPVAWLASAGRGYLPPIGWVFLTVALAQILAVLGWGSWFPWAVPALFSELAGPHAEQIGPHSFIMVALASAAGLAATVAWWYKADQTH